MKPVEVRAPNHFVCGNLMILIHWYTVFYSFRSVVFGGAKIGSDTGGLITSVRQNMLTTEPFKIPL